MPEHDMVIDNDIPSAVQTDINNALAAIVQFNSKAGAPTATFPHMIYADTTATPSQFKVRDAADAAFNNLFTDTGLWRGEDGSETAPAHSFASGTGNGGFLATTNEYGIATNGSEKIRIDSGRVSIGGRQC